MMICSGLVAVSNRSDPLLEPRAARTMMTKAMMTTTTITPAMGTPYGLALTSLLKTTG
jgi:hypothetical protein